jgi:FlaA1/EpsC-like NDP-sugar epimerase
MPQTEQFDPVKSDEMRGWNIRAMRILLVHAVLFAVSLFLSFLVSNDMHVGASWFPRVFFIWVAAIVFIKLVIFGMLHQFQGWWRYVSVSDLVSIIKGSYLSTLIIVVLWYLLLNTGLGPVILKENQPEDSQAVMYQFSPLHPIQVLMMDWVATIVIVCGVRLAMRLYYEESQTVAGGRASRILIVGAGNAGEVLLREIHRIHSARYNVVGFVDDDPKKWGVRIHGVSVLGPVSHLNPLAKKHKIEEIVIAIPSATRSQIRRIIEQCQGAKLKYSMVPDLVEIASGKVKVSQMRDVDIKDLLGRDPVKLDTELISEFLHDKVILITGAGGSIGSEMCRQVGHYKPRLLVMVEQAENALFFIQHEFRATFPDIPVRGHICDITDRRRVELLFEDYRPNVVIHAAAHKHVPLMEEDPGEAIKNNVVGTRTVAETADKYHVKNFVFISTDKAVNPTSIMGSSKRLAEMSIQCLNKRSETDYVMVRFGNVLGSNGSVIPIFRQQIAAGGPVTVTHPEMRRYFMTIPEASQLVLQAAAMGRGGEIFVLDMGEPVKIVDLAREMITLSGFRIGEDIEIKFTGMRPGEKLFEELAMTGENMQPTRHPKIGIWKNEPPDAAILNVTVEKLVALADQPDNYDKIVAIIKEVVPEYVGDVDSLALHRKHQAQNANSMQNSPTS